MTEVTATAIQMSKFKPVVCLSQSGNQSGVGLGGLVSAKSIANFVPSGGSRLKSVETVNVARPIRICRRCPDSSWMNSRNKVQKERCERWTNLSFSWPDIVEWNES